MPSMKPIAVTSATLTLTRNVHANGVSVVLNTATGVTVTLPQATGSGDEYEITVGTSVTSNNHIIQVANSTDIIQGAAVMPSPGTSGSFSSTATSDTITMNGGTTGGIKGSSVTIKDVATGLFVIKAGAILATGTAATPFSAAV